MPLKSWLIELEVKEKAVRGGAVAVLALEKAWFFWSYL